MKADIESLRITGGVHGVAYRDYHRLLCKTFPFAVYYTKSGREITIYAVVDCRRDPAWIRGHSSNRSEPLARRNDEGAVKFRFQCGRRWRALRPRLTLR